MKTTQTYIFDIWLRYLYDFEWGNCFECLFINATDLSVVIVAVKRRIFFNQNCYINIRSNIESRNGNIFKSHFN